MNVHEKLSLEVLDTETKKPRSCFGDLEDAEIGSRTKSGLRDA